MNNFPPVKRIRLSKHQGTRGADIDAIELAVHEAGTGPAVVMCHGFPELAYSWHHQLKAIFEGGFRAIVPDMRGYGNSDCPAAIEDYDLEHLTADMAALLDALDIEKAVFAGHDWGGFVAWAMPVLSSELSASTLRTSLFLQHRSTAAWSTKTTKFITSGFKSRELLRVFSISEREWCSRS